MMAEKLSFDKVLNKLISEKMKSEIKAGECEDNSLILRHNLNKNFRIFQEQRKKANGLWLEK